MRHLVALRRYRCTCGPKLQDLLSEHDTGNSLADEVTAISRHVRFVFASGSKADMVRRDR
jgi:hypothetical protein